MKYQIIYTQRAIDDLKKIADFIILNSGNKETAIKFINELMDAIKVLEDYPSSGFFPKNRSLRCMGYRYVVFKDYLAFYLVKDDKVYVMAIINSKQDYFRYNIF